MTSKRREPVRPEKIVSGGQTGVDRAALDVAISLGIPHGGWCPRGRRAEDGQIPDCYRLEETVAAEYPERTERNVIDSDATLILCGGRPAGGTLLSLRLAKKHEKPCWVVDLDRPCDPAAIRRWMEKTVVRTLNIAGPRESQQPGVGTAARAFLMGLFS